MKKTVYDITLPLGQGAARQQVTVKRYDSHATLRLRPISGGKPYPVEEDCRGVFTARKPDGTVIYNSCLREGNVFVYDLTPQTTAAAGLLRCELKLYGPDEALLTSAAFLMEVEDTVYSGDEELASSQEAEALTRITDTAQKRIAEMEQVLQDAEDLVRVDDTAVGENVWSGKHTADKLCPAFELSGSVVECEPLEGYPLEIRTAVSDDAVETLELQICGVNLLPISKTASKTINGVTFTNNGDGTITVNGTATTDATFNYYAESTNAVPYFEGGMRLSGCPAGGSTSTFRLWLGWVGQGDTGKGLNYSTTSETAKGYWSKQIAITVYAGYTAENLIFKPMISAGTTKHDYEPYREPTVLSADFSSLLEYAGYIRKYDWNTGIVFTDDDEYYQHNPEAGTFALISDVDNYEKQTVRSTLALSGINTIYDVSGTVEVSGRKDLVAVIENLTNAIIALGGNV